ncbi:MAG: FHA domain-containing protein [Planctomycetes bacterium]|nr:FHA domain-containing protein [Planctomycetota bacterium]
MGSRIFIYHVSGAKQGEIEVCTSNVVRIGRQPGCEVQVDPYADLYASGHHAQITWVGGEQFTLADTGSKLGTFKNDLKVVDPVAITTGDVITLGRDRQGRTGPQLRFYLDRDILKCPGCQDPVYKRHFTCPSCTQKFCLRCIDFRQKTCKPCGQRPQAMPAAPGFPPPPPGRDPFGPVGSNSEPELRIPDLAVYTSANPPAPPGTRPPDASGSGRLGPGSARLAQAAQPHSGDSARLERSGSGRMASSGSNAFPRPQVPQAPGSDRFPGASPGPTPSGYVPTISSTARAPQAPLPPSPPTDDDAASIFSDSVDGGDDSFEAEAPPAIPCERCSAPLSAADFFVCATCHKRLCPKHHHGGESCDRCLAVDQSLLETDDDPPPAWAGPRPPMPPQAPAVPLPVGAGSELTGVDFECPGCGIALAPKAETCPGCWRKLK